MSKSYFELILIPPFSSIFITWLEGSYFTRRHDDAHWWISVEDVMQVNCPPADFPLIIHYLCWKFSQVNHQLRGPCPLFAEQLKIPDLWRDEGGGPFCSSLTLPPPPSQFDQRAVQG